MNALLFKPLAISFLISLTMTPITIFIFKKMGWLDDPRKKQHPKNIHNQPIPRGGGISIFMAVFITALMFLTVDPHLKAILLAAFITLVFGALDDIFEINPYIRLITNIISALIIINSGISIKFITDPLGGILQLETNLGFFKLSDLLTLVWIVWCMNVVGWSAGVDGQLPGFVAITSFVIGLLSLRFAQDITQWPVVILAGAVTGAYLGFLPFNFYPQKIMPGYSGKSLAGLFLATLAILSGAKLATVILTLGIPMVDGIWAVVRRLRRGKIPVWGDAEHLHHLLLKVGVSKPAVAIIYCAFSAILGVIVLNLNSKQKLWAFMMVIAGMAILIISLKRIIRKNHSNFSA